MKLLAGVHVSKAYQCCTMRQVQRSRTIAIVVAAFCLGGCASGPPLTAGGSWRSSITETATMDDADLPEAAPAFLAHFTDPVYDDPAGEFAPFGSDEGFDLLYEWVERRDELGAGTTVDDLIEDSGFADVVAELDTPEGPGIPVPGGQVDAATITVGAAFTLLRLGGHIDDAGRRQTLRALDILIRRYDSPPELLRQRADLESWTN